MWVNVNQHSAILYNITNTFTGQTDKLWSQISETHSKTGIY